MRTRFSAVAAISLVLAGLFIFSRGVKSDIIALVPSSGIDNTLGTMKILSPADLSQMAASDNSRNGTAGNWSQVETYDENKYIEFDFTPSLPATASISGITITHQYYTQATLSAAKLEVWNGTSFQDVPISLPPKTGSGGEISETKDISSLSISPTSMIKVRFLAYRSNSLSSVANLKTFHNYVGISIVYTMPTPSVTETVSLSPTPSDTFTSDASGSVQVTPTPSIIEVTETPPIQIQTPLPTPFPMFEPESDETASNSFKPVASGSFEMPSPSPTASPSFTPTPEATPSASFTIASVSLMAVIAPPKIVHHAIKANPRPSMVPSPLSPPSHIAQAKMSVIHIWRLLTRYLSMLKR